LYAHACAETDTRLGDDVTEIVHAAEHGRLNRNRTEQRFLGPLETGVYAVPGQFDEFTAVTSQRGDHEIEVGSVMGVSDQIFPFIGPCRRTDQIREQECTLNDIAVTSLRRKNG
jgi:hypothetical protein